MTDKAHFTPQNCYGFYDIVIISFFYQNIINMSINFCTLINIAGYLAKLLHLQITNIIFDKGEISLSNDCVYTLLIGCSVIH